MKTVLVPILFLIFATAAHAEGDAVLGKSVYLKCTGCHSFDPKKRKIGPTLSGIFGRNAGTVEGFRYSKAMKNLNVNWDELNLIAFLTSPKKYAKGTKMIFAGIRNQQDIKNLLAYLRVNGG